MKFPMFDFSQAFAYLKAGARVRRSVWHDGVWVAIQMPNENSKMKRPYLYMRLENGDYVPYTLENDALFSRDWMFDSFPSLNMSSKQIDEIYTGLVNAMTPLYEFVAHFPKTNEPPDHPKVTHTCVSTDPNLNVKITQSPATGGSTCGYPNEYRCNNGHKQMPKSEYFAKAVIGDVSCNCSGKPNNWEPHKTGRVVSGR